MVQGALNFSPANAEQRNLRICDLVDSQTGLWDSNRLVQLFGFQNCMEIISSLLPPSPDKGQDRLVFSAVTNGVFTVKKSYLRVRMQWVPELQEGAVTKQTWEAIWKKGDVVPRVRLFIWKIMQNGLPLSKTITHRIGKGDSTCLLCNRGEEDGFHLFFGCDFARACWFSSPPSIRSDQ